MNYAIELALKHKDALHDDCSVKVRLTGSGVLP